MSDKCEKIRKRKLRLLIVGFFVLYFIAIFIGINLGEETIQNYMNNPKGVALYVSFDIPIGIILFCIGNLIKTKKFFINKALRFFGMMCTICTTLFVSYLLIIS